MNRRNTITIILILVFLISAFAVYNYMINIYEVVYKVTPDALYADGKSVITIQAVPVNGLGWKALFREAEADYKIIEGADLVKIVMYDRSEGVIKLRAGNKPGVVKIIAKSSYSLLPSPVNFQIYPNIVEVTHEVNGII
jgi:hypothetical protein